MRLRNNNGKRLWRLCLWLIPALLCGLTGCRNGGDNQARPANPHKRAGINQRHNRHSRLPLLFLNRI